MKKQNLIIIIALAILVSLGSFAYFKMSKISVDNTLNTNEIVNNITEQEEIDTTDWIIFEDQKLGISYKHPVDCDQNWAGPGTDYTHLVRCYPDIMMSYDKALNHFPNYDDDQELSIKDIADIYHDLNKNIQDENISDNRILTDVEKININNNEAYQFIIDSVFYTPCSDDYTKYCDGGAVYGKRKITFIGNNDYNMLIRIKYDNIIEDAMLRTFDFID